MYILAAVAKRRKAKSAGRVVENEGRLCGIGECRETKKRKKEDKKKVETG